MTIKYPINATYDNKDGLMFEGFATSLQDATAQVDATDWAKNLDPKTEAFEIMFGVLEAGPVCKTRSEAEQIWRQEINAGYCRIIQVHLGWKAEISCFQAEYNKFSTA